MVSSLARAIPSLLETTSNHTRLKGERSNMAFTFKLPDVGEGMAEGEIVSWLVEKGDTVEEGDSVAEVQNDKSVEELASPVDGTIQELSLIHI